MDVAELRRKRLVALEQPKRREIVDLSQDSPEKKQPLRKKSKLAAGVSSSLNNETDGEPLSFKVLSYNIWFGITMDGAPHPAERMERILDLIRTESPSWIGFQEVTPHLASLLGPPLTAAGYRWFEQPQNMHYGVAVAAKNDLPITDAGWRPYCDTIMGRGFVYVQTERTLFLTTHLESFQKMGTGGDYSGSSQRQKQLKELAAFCDERKSAGRTCIVTGDLNWDDERRKPQDPALLSLLSNDWIDAFLETRSSPKDNGYTYDGPNNPNLSNKFRRRLDRCLILGPGQPEATKLLGLEPIEGLSYRKVNPYNGDVKHLPVGPSDHFGLVVDMKYPS